MATRSRLRLALATAQAIARSATTPRRPPFALSREGAALVHALKTKARASRGTGLRIVVDSEHRSLSMSLAERESHDQIISTDGAHVFLSADAAERLQGCTLQAAPAADGASFYLDRPAATSEAITD